MDLGLDLDPLAEFVGNVSNPPAAVDPLDLLLTAEIGEVTVTNRVASELTAIGTGQSDRHQATILSVIRRR
jgi:hypothetical protein